MKYIIALTGLGFGVLLIIIALLSILSKRKILRTGKHTYGTVRDIKKYDVYLRRFGKSTLFYPVIEFHSENHYVSAKYKINCTTYDQYLRPVCKYQISDKVPIIYNPKKPKKFVINDPELIYTNDYILLLVGISFVISIIIFYCIILYA